MKNKTLWLDVDGVLLNYTEAFLRCTKRKQTLKEVTQYSLAPLFDGGMDEMLVAMEKFHNSEDFEDLEPLVSKGFLDQLIGCGYNLKLITQLEGAKPRASRIANIEHYFPNMFNEIIFTCRGESKAAILMEMEQEKPIMVVEDNPKFFHDIKGDKNFYGYAIVHTYNEYEIPLANNIGEYQSLTDVVDELCNS